MQGYRPWEMGNKKSALQSLPLPSFRHVLDHNADWEKPNREWSATWGEETETSVEGGQNSWNLGADCWHKAGYVEIFYELWKAWDFTQAASLHVHLPGFHGYTRRIPENLRLLGQRQRTKKFISHRKLPFWGLWRRNRTK